MMMPGVFSPPTTNMQAVFSPYTQMPQMPQQQQQMQAQQAMPQPQQPIMNPNNNFMMAALSGNNAPSPTVGTPNTNTPSTNMQNSPFLSQLRAPATGIGMQ